MGDEVTKKDLQSLQGYCNKQIADLKKSFDAEVKRLDAMDADDNRITVNLSKSLRERLDGVDKRLNELQSQIDKLASR